MSKPTISFDTVYFNLNGKHGYRPQLQHADPVSDGDFADEVVQAKRLSASAYEALHIVQAFAEVGPQKVAEDGRPRCIPGFIKWVPKAGGSVESPDSPWDPNTCSAKIKPVLLADAKKRLDANFVNVNGGIGVRLSNVTYLGATKVQNVIKVGEPFAAYGNHMEWIAGDTATLSYQDGALKRTVALTCTSSDVSQAEFTFPRKLAGLEPGTLLTFEMHSRGGVEAGQVYTSRKQVTLLAYTGDKPLVASVKDGELPVNTVTFGDGVVTIKGAGLGKATTVKFGTISGSSFDKSVNGADLTHDGDNILTCKFPTNTSGMTDEELLAASAAGNLYLAALGPNGFTNPLPVKYAVSA